MARIGYARVSTTDQNTDIQIQRLEAADCNPIRHERVSGKSLEGRDELASILDFIREGDELVVVKLDRLGRSTRDVLNLVHGLEEKGASLRVLEPDFCTGNGTGKILETVLGMVAEMEREFIKERQRAGIEEAKARGVYKGRKPSVPVDEIKKLSADGLGATAIAKQLNVSRMSVYRALSAE